ncbi:LapD/MoxY N-terminal periplasmic domain-containing protein [Aeromonas crassostreae]
MSLAKLLNGIILILFLIGAVLLFMLEITTVRQSILDQMSANLETAITALGLVLQGTLLNEDKVLAETIVNAMFDGGFVSAITLVDPDGQMLFHKVFTSTQQNVPAWLPHIIAMPPVKVEQELTDGWRILGSLTLEGHSGYAYQHLWGAISRTGLALLAGLIVFSLLIPWICHRLLRPLVEINQQLELVRKRQYGSELPTPWLLELKAVAGSVNQLISERKRDMLQQRLKITQLGKQQEASSHLPLLNLRPLDERWQQQHFYSTQGDILLYRRLLPLHHFSCETPIATLQQAVAEWLDIGHEGLSLPLSLLAHAQWDQLATTLAEVPRGRIIDWCWDLVTLPANAVPAFMALERAGVAQAFSAIPLNNEVLTLLDPVQPTFISLAVTNTPLYWNLVSQSLHGSGYTVLAQASSITDPDILRAWGIDGYAAGASS